MWTFEGLSLPAWEILLNEWWQLRNSQIKTMWDRSRGRIIKSQRTERKSTVRETEKDSNRKHRRFKVRIVRITSRTIFSYRDATWMNIFSACQETHCWGFFSWMSRLCLLFNSLHTVVAPVWTSEWRHQFNAALLSIMLSICLLFPLRLSDGVCFGSAAAARGTRTHTQIIQT